MKNLTLSQMASKAEDIRQLANQNLPTAHMANRRLHQALQNISRQAMMLRDEIKRHSEEASKPKSELKAQKKSVKKSTKGS